MKPTLSTAPAAAATRPMMKKGQNSAHQPRIRSRRKVQTRFSWKFHRFATRNPTIQTNRVQRNAHGPGSWNRTRLSLPTPPFSWVMM